MYNSVFISIVRLIISARMHTILLYICKNGLLKLFIEVISKKYLFSKFSIIKSKIKNLELLILRTGDLTKIVYLKSVKNLEP